MSINKGTSKNKIPTRVCAEHGICCTCRRSHPIGSQREPKKNHWSDLKVDGVRGKKYIKK